MSTRVLIREGIETKDGRLVEPGAVTWPNLPLPIIELGSALDSPLLGHIVAVECRNYDLVALCHWRDDLPLDGAPEALYADLDWHPSGLDLGDPRDYRTSDDGNSIVGPLRIVCATLRGAHAGPLDQWAWA